MIMDEVLAVGDMAFQKKCLDKMRQAAKQEGRTVLYVSHNMNTIRRLCDRCVVLDKGRIIFDGNVEEAISIYSQNVYDLSLKGRTEFDLNETAKRSPYTAGTAKLTYLKLLGKERAVYAAGETIRLSVRVETKRKYEELFFRFELRYKDETPIGAMPGVLLGAFQPGESRDFEIEVTPVDVANGQYRADIVLFEKDEFGNSFDQELILPAFLFDVEGVEKQVWDHTNWGHVRFQEAYVKPIGFNTEEQDHEEN